MTTGPAVPDGDRRPRGGSVGIDRVRYDDNRTSASDIVSRVTITGVAAALGLLVRRGRTIARWRRGEHYSVSLSDPKGAWHDHVTGEGGGILALIQHVRGGDRQDALRWLADYAGVTLDDRVTTAAERREWARRRAAAEREAEHVAAWRADVLLTLQARRDDHQHLYHAGLRWILGHGLTDAHGVAVADVTDAHETAYRRLDAHLATLQDATPSEWLRMWREHLGVAA